MKRFNSLFGLVVSLSAAQCFRFAFFGIPLNSTEPIYAAMSDRRERLFGGSGDDLAAGFERKVTFAFYFLKPFYSDTSHQSKD